MIGANVQLVSPLGEGGMGMVWLADHLTLRARVVVKFMSEELAATAEGRSRFSREAAAAARVRSPHVVQTLDHGVTAEGVPYIVLELLEGHDLGRRIETQGRIPPQEFLVILAQLARALARVHECGIIHRDIKPSNIFLSEVGGGEVFVKLLDFGIAKSARGDDIGAQLGGATSTGVLVGTPYYMSPEQLTGAKDVDHRTDLWSVGVVTYEAITGVKPFDAASLASLAVAVMRDELPRPSLRNPEIPASVDDWFAKACARDPAARFNNMREMIEAFAASLGEIAPAVVSARPGVSLAPRPIASAETNPLGSTVSPNATTLHDTSRSGVATQPGTRPLVPAARSGRLIGLGASALVAVAIVAVVFMKMKTDANGTSGPARGLAQSTAGNSPAVPVSESVPLAIASASPLAPPSATASAAPSTSSTVAVSRPRDAGATGANATSPTASSSIAPPAASTTKKPPVPKPGNTDDVY
jgi:serine/threonine-protein kinase